LLQEELETNAENFINSLDLQKLNDFLKWKTDIQHRSSIISKFKIDFLKGIEEGLTKSK